MEPNIVKFKDYDGFLPKPAMVPGHVFTIEGHPESLCNGYMIDLHSNHVTDKTEMIKSGPIEGILSDIYLAKELTRPRYICDHFYGDMQIFVLFTLDKVPIAVQTNYYQYFYYRYQGCQFKGNGNIDPIGVYHIDRIVGVIMPVIISKGVDIPYYEEGTG